MKKYEQKLFAKILLLAIMVIHALMIFGAWIGTAMAETADVVASTPYTWEILSSIPGAAALALLVTQVFKWPMDKVWKIPTRVLVYLIALVSMLMGTAFTGGLTASSALLAAVNALVAAFSAMGAYEVTFKKMEIKAEG